MKQEVLEKIEHIVVHGECADGTASAIILANVFPRANVTFCKYGGDKYESLECKENMIFCDIIPPEARTDEFVKAGAIVLDHHKYAKNIISKYEYHKFADEKEEPGVSGALLAYRHVYVPIFGEDKSVKDFAILAGIRDTWQKDNSFWVDACAQAEVLEFYDPEEYWLEDPILPLTEEEMDLGEVLYNKKIKLSKNIAKESYIKSVGRYKVAVFQTEDASDVSNELVSNYGVNICMGFNYYCKNNQAYIGYSCRSDGSFDVGAMAKHFKGGGHTKASGFRRELKELNEMNPYQFTIDLILKFLEEDKFVPVYNF